MPLFSIIIPIYKVERYLNDCVESVLNQTFKDYELILVDDGSPDNCPAMCDEFARKDKRVVVIHKENGGLSHARNVGMEKATGEYILFIDSDDRYKTLDGLEALAKRIAEYHEDIIQISTESIFLNTGRRSLERGNYDFDIINQGDKALTINYLQTNRQFAGSAWLLCVKRSLITENNLTFPVGLTSEDFVWLMKVQYYAKSYGAVDGLVYEYKNGVAGSITSNVNVRAVEGTHSALVFWKSKSDCPQGLNEYAAYIFILLVYTYAAFSKEDKIAASKFMKEDMVVMSKTKMPRNIIIRWMIKILGFNTVSLLLRKIK